MRTLAQAAPRRFTTRGPRIILSGAAGDWLVVVGTTPIGEICRLNTRRWLNSAYDITRSRKAGVTQLIARVLRSGGQQS